MGACAVTLRAALNAYGRRLQVRVGCTKAQKKTRVYKTLRALAFFVLSCPRVENKNPSKNISRSTPFIATRLAAAPLSILKKLKFF
jgi:hypothetical protein